MGELVEAFEGEVDSGAARECDEVGGQALAVPTDVSDRGAVENLARQAVARFAPSGTGIEIGWGSPTSTQRTLAGVTDPGAANPPPGATTPWGESFKRFLGIH